MLIDSQGTGPISGEWTETGFTEQISWVVPIADFTAFLTAVGGKTTTFGSGTGATITRIVPLQSPHFPFLWARTLTYKLLGADANINPRTRPTTHAIVTVNFITPNYLVNSGTPYVTVNTRASTQFITVPGTNYTFGNGEVVETNVGIQVSQIEISVTLHQLPSLQAAYGILAPALGKVNDSTLTLDGSTYAAGTVLFPTFESVRQNLTSGQISQELTYSFIFRELAWNSGIRSDGVADTLTPALYDTYNHNLLVY